MQLIREDVLHTYRVEIDRKVYRVVHGWSMNYHQPFHERGDGRTERWSVYASRGAWGERECDPAKPTYKQVVAKIQEYLAELAERTGVPTP